VTYVELRSPRLTMTDLLERPIFQRLKAVLLPSAEPALAKPTNDVHASRFDKTTNGRVSGKHRLITLGRVRTKEDRRNQDLQRHVQHPYYASASRQLPGRPWPRLYPKDPSARRP
jgi:hypothetical protein